MAPGMAAEALRAICREHELYSTPELNDRLYCNFRGFTRLGGLENYTGLRALFLEGNALTSLAGLPPLPELKCLYLQQNMLTSLDGLRGAAAQLHTLNLSGNSLAGLDGLAGCTQLQTLLAADNELESAHALADLEGLPCLETVDLQGSQLADPGATLRLLATLPRLKCLYLKGTPLVRAAQNYRKRVIAALPGLTYLDDRPVFEQERRCAEAWERGGIEEERAERDRCAQEHQARALREFESLQAVRAAAFAKRRAALGLPAGDADPFSALEERRLEPSGERSEASVAEAWRGEAGGSGGETVCEEVDGGGAA